MSNKKKEMLIGGNWKLNPETLAEAKDLASGITLPASDGVGAVLFPPLVFLEELVDEFPHLTWGGQDFYQEDAGAYTGEVSLPMLKSIGTGWVLVGHSDRRGKFNETDEDVNKKARAALVEGFNVILAVGEKRKEGGTEQVIASLKASTKDIPAEHLSRLTVAYEPVWAISATAGSKPATPEYAERVIRALKNELDVRYIYGGSVDSKNAKSFFARPAIQGALIGGASLKAGEFSEILRIASDFHPSSSSG